MKPFSLGVIPAVLLGLSSLAFAPPHDAPVPPEKSNAAPAKTEPTLPPEQAAVVQAAQFSQAKPVALALRGLDKMTGRPTDIIAPIGKPVKFATLTITVRTCYSTPPTEPPETTAFLEITDKRPQEKPKKVFSGWMFASTPSINGMEHPLYDVWVISCKTNAPGVIASVAPAKVEAKPVSPNVGAEEEMPELPEDAGQ